MCPLEYRSQLLKMSNGKSWQQRCGSFNVINKYIVHTGIDGTLYIGI